MPTIYKKVRDKYSYDFVKGLKKELQGQKYPVDEEFREKFKTIKFHGNGDMIDWTKFILELLEQTYNHKEAVNPANLQIEHVLPQTCSDWWQTHLGENWRDEHQVLKDTIGNLTLTAKNQELSNFDLERKKEILSDSHLELNRYFMTVNTWKADDIKKRAEDLAQRALTIWSNFSIYN